MKIFHLLMLLCLISNCKSKVASPLSSTAKKPNIIIILIDDAGYVDFGFMGSNDLETPNIDQLAKSGIIFNDAHVTSTVCAPSRAGLITGTYQQHFGFEANGTGTKTSGEIGLSDNVTTIANVFKANKYKTIAIGKWHLGHHTNNHPNQRGFDEFFGFLAGSRSYFPIKNPTTNQMLQQNGNRIEFEGYLTDVLGNRASNFVKENKDNPFFMYLSFNAVHTPMHAKTAHLKKYEGHSRQKLAAMTWSLDENIGKLRQTLKQNNILDNTLIFFLSDNGGAVNNQSFNGKLKGFKGNMFEAGHRVPFVVSWPKVLQGNQIFNGLTSSLDIFKTAIAASLIEENPQWKLDGVNLLPYIQGDKKGDPHQQLFWRKLEHAAVRIGQNKLVRLKDYGHVLYDLKNDIGESIDIKMINPNLAKTLNTALESWESTIMPPLWDEGEYWKSINFDIHKNLMENKYHDVESMNIFLKNKSN